MKDPIANMLLVVSFFTRIPLSKHAYERISHVSGLANAVLFFPFAGLIVATLPIVVWTLSNFLFPAPLAAGLTLLATGFITGLLHEDGLADCADGLGGTPDRKKALEIMRDSRLGTYGAVALIFAVALKWFALSEFTISEGIVGLLIVHIASRSAITIGLYETRYARPEGLGELVEGEIPVSHFIGALCIGLLAGGIFGGLAGIFSVVAAYGLSWLWRLYFVRRLGGYTGDTLGAIQQLAEISIFIVLAGSFL